MAIVVTLRHTNLNETTIKSNLVGCTLKDTINGGLYRNAVNIKELIMLLWIICKRLGASA